MNTIQSYWNQMEEKAREVGKTEAEIFEMRSIFYAGAGAILFIGKDVSREVVAKKISEHAATAVINGLMSEFNDYYEDTKGKMMDVLLDHP